jgi:hypothetical protein
LNVELFIVRILIVAMMASTEIYIVERLTYGLWFPGLGLHMATAVTVTPAVAEPPIKLG